MTNRAKTILALATVAAIVATGFLTRDRWAAEDEAKATLSAAVEVDAVRSGDVAAFLTERGPDDIDPADVASFDGFPVYGASEAYQARFGTLQRVTRLRTDSANPLQGLDALRLTYGDCTAGECQHHVTLVVGPSCMRPLPLIAEIALRRESLFAGRETFIVPESALAPVEVPSDGDEIVLGDTGPEVGVFYVGGTVIEMRGGALFVTGDELAPLNAPAQGAWTGDPPAPAPSQAPCAG